MKKKKVKKEEKADKTTKSNGESLSETLELP